MKLRDAIQLLQLPETVITGKQTWADLGCGNGLFTKALAQVLEPGNIIYAVDTNLSSLNEIPGVYNGQVIKKIQNDFLKDKLALEKLDGILMANSLHFVENKPGFIQNAGNYLKQKHHFIIIEYDTDLANHWVPYPLSFHALHRLFSEAGYNKILKLREKSSIYRNGNIYSAIIVKI